MLVNEEFAPKYYDLLDKLKPDSTIEIGAYDAEFSQHMSSKINPKDVWAFEAVPTIHNSFKEKLTHINYINLAISEKEQEVLIGELPIDTTVNMLSGASSILPRVVPQKATTIKVRSNSLDNIVVENNVSGKLALWIDCEGANKEVLSGSINTLKDVIAIYIEVETEQVWVDAWLKNDTVQFLNDHGFILIDQSNDSVQHDCIFVRKELLPLT